MRKLLGKRDPRLDLRTLRLSTYLPKLPAAPPEADWTTKLSSLGAMMNDQLGCCGLAGPGHLIQCQTSANGAEVIIPDYSIVKAYEDVGGYVKGDPSTDGGVVLLDVMNYWRQTGFVDAAGKAHKIDAFVALDLKNRDHFEKAIAFFGGVILGFSLPLSAQNQRVWSLALGGDLGSPRRGSWGGHCVPSAKFTREDGNPGRGLDTISWGARYGTTWPFLDAMADEAFAVASKDWASATGSPAELVYDDIMNDLQEIAA